LLFVSHEQLISGAAVPRMEDFLGTRLDKTLIKPELSRAKGCRTLPDRIERLFEQLKELSRHER
jgi:hypothetical protein